MTHFNHVRHGRQIFIWPTATSSDTTGQDVVTVGVSEDYWHNVEALVAIDLGANAISANMSIDEIGQIVLARIYNQFAPCLIA